MLFYLDNWVNTKEGFDPREGLRAQLGSRGGRGRRAMRDVNEKAARISGINENYARELMELHTLGVDGGYEQKDVVEVAHAPHRVVRRRPASRARQGKIGRAHGSLEDAGGAPHAPG